ncbi:glycosyl hydrolase [Micromonospora sp. NPDC023737]|uniref:glycosyl hydrolase n=1 Tax=unclassified Micromonospora TaxID=2617518 RepID=UPI0033D3CD29
MNDSTIRPNVGKPISRRGLLRGMSAAGALALTIGALKPADAYAAGNPSGAAGPLATSFAQDLKGKYLDPDRTFSSDVRWWLGDAAHTDETLLEQIQALYDGGFRGVELCMQNDAGAPDAVYAYGSDMWSHKWNLMMNKLLDLGMSVYLTSGTNWSTSNVPGLDPDSQAAMQNLTLGTGTVNPGETLTVLPAPAPNARRTGARFVTAYAYKVVSDNAVDPERHVDLSVTQGTDVWTQSLSWTAPSDGTYRVFAIWTQGTYQASSPSTETSYATNYFDARGVAALRAFWEQHYLSDPTLRQKILDGDVQLFMDSLEINPGTAGITWWAEDMAAEFEKRKGYDIMPFVFLMYGLPQVNAVYNAYIDRAKGTYDLAGDADRREKIINDFLDVLTNLYVERMLTPLKEWLNSVGIETRAQISYGRSFEISEPIMAVDYPEAENFNQYDQVDIFRLWSGGAKLTNKVLSSESGAELPQYTTRQMQVKDFYRTYAAGFQRMIWHVWAAEFAYGNYAWPGFSRNFFHPGTRHPSARDYDEYNAHLGRVQQLLRTGKARSDVGFIHNNWNQGLAFRAENNGTNPRVAQMNWQLAHMGVYYRSTELQDNGYTYDYFSPAFLFEDGVYFDNGSKTLEPAGYKAIVLYQDWLDLKGARKILSLARKGLKVVILGDAATRTPFNDGLDAELKDVIDKLKKLHTVRVASVFDAVDDYFSATPGGYHDDVMTQLQDMGVYPYAGYVEENQQLLTQTREDEDGNRFLYAYNYDDGSYRNQSLRPEVRDAPNPGKNIKTKLVMEGEFVPYSIDAWTGDVTQLAIYEWSNGRTLVPIDLDFNNITLMAFEKVKKGQLHKGPRIVSTNADSAYALPDGVVIRAKSSGILSTKLSNGKLYRSNVTVPAPYDITGWDLTVESWRPNSTERNLVRTETIDGLTSVNTLTSTVKTPINVHLDKLDTWNNIPQVGKAVSGTGHYEASFTWDASKASGAYLDFGDQLTESMKVWINGQKVGGQVSTNPTKVKKNVGGVGKPTIDDGTGQQVPLVGHIQYTGGISLTKPVIDISPYLRDGVNKIVIDYSSTLQNLQLDRGVIPVQFNSRSWWQNDQVYLDYGPKQAKVLPFVEMMYSAK